jgi:hypothetical protein
MHRRRVSFVDDEAGLRYNIHRYFDAATQLAGPFDTLTLNVGFITVQWAEDASGMHTASSGFAKGLGFDFNRYQVNTDSAATFYRRGGNGCH